MASLMPCRPFPREPRYKVSMRTAVPGRQCTMLELKFHLLREEEDHETGEWTQRGKKIRGTYVSRNALRRRGILG